MGKKYNNSCVKVQKLLLSLNLRKVGKCQGHEVKIMIYWESWSCQSNAHGAHICHSQIKI